MNFEEFKDEIDEIHRCCCEGYNDEVSIIDEKDYNDRLRKLFEKVKNERSLK